MSEIIPGEEYADFLHKQVLATHGLYIFPRTRKEWAYREKKAAQERANREEAGREYKFRQHRAGQEYEARKRGGGRSRSRKRKMT